MRVDRPSVDQRWRFDACSGRAWVRAVEGEGGAPRLPWLAPRLASLEAGDEVRRRAVDRPLQ